MSTDDPAGTPADAPHKGAKVRNIGLTLLTVAAAVVALGIVFVRGTDGPLVLQNAGPTVIVPVRSGDDVAATVVVRMPGSKRVRITAVRATVTGGLRVRDNYASPPRGITLAKTAYPWPDEEGNGPEASELKQPGAFVTAAGPSGGAWLTVVARTTAVGRQEIRRIEVDYSDGIKRHRKRFKTAIAVCVNPADIAVPIVTSCPGGPRT